MTTGDFDDAIVMRFREAQEAAVLEVADQGLLTLASLVASGAIDVAPSFQRRDRWDTHRQSLLIESLLSNIPVPPVYLAEDAARMGSYAVIDGKQRLTSISAFFSDELQLRGLSRFPVLNGYRYSDLPDGVRNPLGMKSLRVTTLLRQSDEALKHEVFLRLNTGGEVLNAQEIRNVAYRGPLNDLIVSLGENVFLRKQFKVEPPNSQAYRQMMDVEFVLRFFMLSETWRTFSGGLRDELDRFMAERRFAAASELEPLRRRFEDAMADAQAIWGDRAFKRPGRDQALAGLFDAEMIGLVALSPKQRKALRSKAAEVVQATDALFADPDFDENVRRATNTPQRLRDRTNSMIEALSRVAS
ncbi:DUF262 domain-containing protein [Patulibacter americanus]|uniref:DUF262 domain-containing protein n=1 Tax=Patulibacter americanus TaxID=588672 RepID=UPI0003B67F3D|nr:DUF262 domain-containing protein [Patulibacter americanus]